MRAPKLDPIEKARIKRDHRCPDCLSRVILMPHGFAPFVHKVDTIHDETCPEYARLRRTGRTEGNREFVATPHSRATEEQFSEAARQLRAIGMPLRTREDLE